VTSIFDRAAFNEALFFPRGDTSAARAGAVDLMIDVGDARVHVRRHAAPHARCTLLLFHGNGEVVADYDRAASEFAAAGAALAVADYRGYGQSTGAPTLRNVIEDARPIADAIGPHIVMGRSLGGAAAHELYARPIASMLGVVLESTYSDVAALIRRRGLEAPALSDVERAQFDPLVKLPLGTLPLLVLHGERDHLIAAREADATLAAAGGSDKRLVLVPDRGHNDVSLSDVYWRALAEFIARIA
jgi:alpha-beta hydrolase superfamily lysophospholipase